MEFIYWGVIPAAIAVATIAASLRLAAKHRGAFHGALASLVIALSGFSLAVLKRILVDGAWPTFLPHLAISGACILVGIQLLLARRAGPNRRAA